MNRKVLYILLVALIGCGENAHERHLREIAYQERLQKARADRAALDSILQPVPCKFDSILVIECNNITREQLKGKQYRHILSNSLMLELKPYLTDSFVKDYSCCPVEKSADLIIFSNGGKCTQYRVVYYGTEHITHETDTSYALLIPDEYQYRIRIPKSKWREVMREWKLGKVK